MTKGDRLYFPLELIGILGDRSVGVTKMLKINSIHYVVTFSDDGREREQPLIHCEPHDTGQPIQ